MREVPYAPAVRRALPWPYAERLLFAEIRVRFPIRLVSSPPETDVSGGSTPPSLYGISSEEEQSICWSTRGNSSW